MLDQRRQGGMHLWLGDDLIVVQDQQEVIGSLYQQVDKLSQNILERWGLWGLQLHQQ